MMLYNLGIMSLQIVSASKFYVHWEAHCVAVPQDGKGKALKLGDAVQ
jgi:hypothetical protein